MCSLAVEIHSDFLSLSCSGTCTCVPSLTGRRDSQRYFRRILLAQHVHGCTRSRGDPTSLLYSTNGFLLTNSSAVMMMMMDDDGCWHEEKKRVSRAMYDKNTQQASHRQLRRCQAYMFHNATKLGLLHQTQRDKPQKMVRRCRVHMAISRPSGGLDKSKWPFPHHTSCCMCTSVVGGGFPDDLVPLLGC